ncbi:hypothetical protein HK102_012597 [Quaeritorhiza haematococci]|nr:hypothetical protein HK102_012597 [Quaeritorhiza haematococci]
MMTALAFLRMQLPEHILEQIIAIDTTSLSSSDTTAELPQSPTTSTSLPIPVPVRKFHVQFDIDDPSTVSHTFSAAQIRQTAAIALTCTEFAQITRRLLWRHLALDSRMKEDARLQRRQVELLLSWQVDSIAYVEDTSQRSLAFTSAVGDKLINSNKSEAPSLSVHTPVVTSLSSKNLISSLRSFSVYVDRDAPWIVDALPRMFSLLSHRGIHHLTIDVSNLLKHDYEEFFDTLFGCIEDMSHDNLVSSTNIAENGQTFRRDLRQLDFWLPEVWLGKPERWRDVERYLGILSRHFTQLRRLSLKNVPGEVEDRGGQNSKNAMSNALVDWIRAIGPTLHTLIIENSEQVLREGALAALAERTSTLEVLVLSPIMEKMLNSDDMERLLERNPRLHKLFLCGLDDNAVGMDMSGSRHGILKENDVLKAISRIGGTLHELELSHLNGLGRWWKRTAETATAASRNSTQHIASSFFQGSSFPTAPLTSPVNLTNLVRLKLIHLPHFPGRLLEDLATAIKRDGDLISKTDRGGACRSFPLKTLHIQACPLVDSFSLIPFLQVSDRLQHLYLSTSSWRHTDGHNYNCFENATHPCAHKLVTNTLLSVLAESCAELVDFYFDDAINPHLLLSQLQHNHSGDECEFDFEEIHIKTLLKLVQGCRNLSDWWFRASSWAEITQWLRKEFPTDVVEIGGRGCWGRVMVALGRQQLEKMRRM